MTEDQYRTHMTLWVILAAPLLAGNDLSKMSPSTLAMLTNKEVIAVDQDPLGKQGDRVSAVGPTEIWSKPLSNGAQAVALFNRSETEKSISFRPRDIGFAKSFKLRDLWQGREVTATGDTYTATVPAYGAVLLKVSR